MYVLGFNGSIHHLTSSGIPVVSFNTGPIGGSTVTTTSVSFTWAGVDSDGSIADYEAALTGPTSTTETTASTSITFENLQNGSYTLCITAQDNNGNTSLPACTSFDVDAAELIPPTVQIEQGPPNGSIHNETHVLFGWSGSDPDGSVVLYEVDLSGPLTVNNETTDTQATFQPLTDGSYTFCVRAQDNDNLWSPQACVDFTVNLSANDLTPPIGAFLNGSLPGRTPNDSGDPERTAPLLLSEIDAFPNLLAVEAMEGLVTYDVIQPFWSDGALKKRWMAIPNDGIPNAPTEQITYSEEDSWGFPIGTVFIKHFEIALDETVEENPHRLETRFFVHGEDGTWYGLTYRWNADQTDATLVEAPGASETLTITTAQGPRTQTWTYPSRLDCMTCHAAENGSVLGANSRQLNHVIYYPDVDDNANQLVELHRRGFLNTDLPNINTVLTLTRVSDTQAPVENRARSYLDVNCGYCHKEAGTGRGFFDARYSVELDNQNLIDGALIDPLGIDGARVIAPGDTTQSVAYVRMTSLNEEVMMPPIAKNRIDTSAISLMRDWILSMEELPVELTRFEGHLNEGAAYLSWTTASEKNNAGFTLERQLGPENSQDLAPERWVSIGFVSGNGTTNAPSEYRYQDTDLPGTSGHVFYRLKQLDFDGTTSYSDVVALDVSGPSQYTLHDNYPNPFNPSTTIVYDIPVESHVELSIFDAQGRLVEVLVNQTQRTGQYTVAFEPDNLVTGIYFYRLRAGDYEQTGQMLFVK